MHLGQRHQMLRRRGLVQTPNKQSVRIIDALAYTVSTLSLLFTLDQVRLVWFDGEVSGVSALTWSLYTLSAVVWLCYGYIHREKVLIVTNIFWVALNVIIVVGVISH